MIFIFVLFHFSMKFLSQANIIAPDGTPRSVKKERKIERAPVLYELITPCTTTCMIFLCTTYVYPSV